jgi:hypothetical protein
VNLDDNALIALLQEKILSEQANAAESKRLADAQEESNRLRQRELERDNRRTGQWAATVERYAELAELVKDWLRQHEAQKGIDREFHNSLSERIDDIEQGLYAILTRDLAEMRRARGSVGGRIDRRAELQTLYRSLEKLKIQAAKYGLDIPLHLQHAIDEKEQQIKEIEGL